MTQSPLIQPIQSDAQLCAACPSKKTPLHKESIYGTDAYRALREELEEANERIAQLEDQLGMTPIAAIPQLGLTPQQGRIFSILMARTQISHQSLHLLLGDLNRHQKPMTPDCAKVQIHIMRRKLKYLCIDIETIWGWGYRLSESSKAIARTILTQGQS